MENIGLAKRLEHTKPVIRSDEMVNYRGDNAENLSNTLRVWNEHFMTLNNAVSSVPNMK